MAVSLFESHRPREASITVSLSPDFSGDYVAPGVADGVTINAAVAEMVGLGGGEIVLGYGDWALTATVNVPANVLLRGIGWETALNYDAGGNCLTITGDNVKIRDLKIVITAGAGAGGTRPNCIFADTRVNLEITKVWLVGDETVADDGSDLRQCGVVFDTVTSSRVSLCKSEDHRRHGISLEGILDNELIGNMCNSNLRRGISITTTSMDNTVTGNTCYGNSQVGLFFATSMDNTVTGNTCHENLQHGIYFFDSIDNTVTGNTCRQNSLNGIYFDNTSHNNTVTGNTCRQNIRHGIQVNTSNSNTIVGNSCNENDSNNANTYDGINITGTSSDNLVHSNTCDDNDRYGISIDDVNALRNWVKNNQLRGNTSGPFQDSGTDTKLATIPIPLIQGTTFISTAAAAWGWEIDLDTEFALGIGWLPPEVQQVVRIRIIGVALVDPGAGNEIRAQFTGEAATFHEPFATHPIDVVDKDCEETDPDVGDVINWVLTATDDADIANIVGGDRLQLKVLHEGAGGGSVATDAIIDTIQLEIV